MVGFLCIHFILQILIAEMDYSIKKIYIYRGSLRAEVIVNFQTGNDDIFVLIFFEEKLKFVHLIFSDWRIFI